MRFQRSKKIKNNLKDDEILEKPDQSQHISITNGQLIDAQDLHIKRIWQVKHSPELAQHVLKRRLLSLICLQGFRQFK